MFSVGSEPVPNFRMIERHYFRDRLIQSFDFTFGFCIPNSTNSWEAIYHMPKLSERESKCLSLSLSLQSPARIPLRLTMHPSGFAHRERHDCKPIHDQVGQFLLCER